MDHVVPLVGYGTDAIGGDFWIIENNWGLVWGKEVTVEEPETREITVELLLCPFFQQLEISEAKSKI